MLEIKDLSVSFGDKVLLNNINLTVTDGARHLLVGPNGSGKSTLVQTIAGNPEYTIKSGSIIFDDNDITHESATRRALMGIFLGAQNVPEIPGLTVLGLLKHSVSAHINFQTSHDLPMHKFMDMLEKARTKLDIPKDWLNRSINVGFSGGERKRLMLLRLVMTNPKLAILDEPDSGADGATQQQIADIIHEMKNTTFIFISHQQKFTTLVSPTHTTTLTGGKIKE